MPVFFLLTLVRVCVRGFLVFVCLFPFCHDNGTARKCKLLPMVNPDMSGGGGGKSSSSSSGWEDPVTITRTPCTAS